MTNQPLLREYPSAGVLQLTFNRPERKNALDRQSIAALIEEIVACNDEPLTRVLVVTGAGGNFSSGGDLADFDLATRTCPPMGQRLMEALNECTKPIVGAVEGMAVGGAVTMLLHFDLVYAGRGARFRLPFVNFGACPEGASSYYLPMNAGIRKASELLMLGDEFDVDTAREAGLVNAATADGASLQTALESARKIASKAPESIRLTKMLIREGHRDTVRRVIAREHGLFSERLNSPEVQQTIAALRGRAKEKA